MTSQRVLIVDDEVPILRAIRTNLEARGLEVTTSQSGEEALRFVVETNPDLVILDLDLAGESGREVLRRLRAHCDVPIIIVSARTGDPERVLALDEGANDYLEKPFAMGDLIMRVRAALQTSASETPTTLATNDFRLDLVAHEATRGGAQVELTPLEWKVLVVLVRSSGRLVTEHQLVHEVWGEGHLDEGGELRRLVTQIRRKLEPEPARPRYLRTEPGFGYRFFAAR
jgi:two-component system KDP operon response regulator KdpE